MDESTQRTLAESSRAERSNAEKLSGPSRQVSPEQMRTFERYAAEMLSAFGLDLDTPSTVETPGRFIKAMYDITSGYDGDPKLIKVFKGECRGGADCRRSQLIEGPIQFYSLCEHHALPIIGQAYLGYIPHERIFGLSKLTRLVRVYAKRFTVQERLGQQIADALVQLLEPHGVAVYLEAQHLCTHMRGVHNQTSTTRTTNWRGTFDDDASLRDEFFRLCERAR
ncbi:MAG TPA: GTP cyclohydrolase I [Nitrolancea sp.]|nr:GTP cyclohydrolase I [Nitrolancea sp.]